MSIPNIIFRRWESGLLKGHKISGALPPPTDLVGYNRPTVRRNQRERTQRQQRLGSAFATRALSTRVTSSRGSAGLRTIKSPGASNAVFQHVGRT